MDREVLPDRRRIHQPAGSSGVTSRSHHPIWVSNGLVIRINIISEISCARLTADTSRAVKGASGTAGFVSSPVDARHIDAMPGGLTAIKKPRSWRGSTYLLQARLQEDGTSSALTEDSPLVPVVAVMATQAPTGHRMRTDCPFATSHVS